MKRLSLACIVLLLGAAPTARAQTACNGDNFGSVDASMGCRLTGDANLANIPPKPNPKPFSPKPAPIDAAKTVGALVADGRCDEAVKTALRDGDFALADQARRFCKSAPPPTAPSDPPPR